MARSFNLQETAIEIFIDNISHFFNLFSKENQQNFLKSLESVKVVTDRSKYIKEITPKWLSGRMSNFEYLMNVNFVSGRSYHDVNMWYIFPWVVSMEDPNKFRDLSLPVGALNPERYEHFLSRLDSLMEEDQMGRFLYGGHYSGSGNFLFLKFI